MLNGATGWRGVDKMDIVQIIHTSPPVPPPEPVPAPAPLMNMTAPISRDLPQNPADARVIAGIVTACFIAIGAATRFIATRHAESLGSGHPSPLDQPLLIYSVKDCQHVIASGGCTFRSAATRLFPLIDVVERESALKGMARSGGLCPWLDMGRLVLWETNASLRGAGCVAVGGVWRSVLVQHAQAGPAGPEEEAQKPSARPWPPGSVGQPPWWMRLA